MYIELEGRPKYHMFTIRKRNGKLRQIVAPDENTKRIQRQVLTELDKLYQPLPCVYGFVKDKSIFDNASQHLGKECVMNIDLKDFFPSVTISMLYRAISKHLVCSNEKKRVLCQAISKWCTCSGRLVQGSVTSPMLSNIAMKDLDLQLIEFANKHELTYTRYADDLTFSGKTDTIYDKILEIKRMVAAEGFTVNESKVHIYKNGRCKQVTGIVVDQKINVKKHKADRLRAILHNIEMKVKDDVIVDAKTLQEQTGFTYNQLEGSISFIMQANPNKYLKYRTQLDDLKFVITR